MVLHTIAPLAQQSCGGGDPQLVEATARRLVAARRVVAFTGAGCSRESGIPTFRDAVDGAGLWDGGAAAAFVFGTPLGFLFAPSTAWRVYCERLLVPISRAAPNRAHRALADLDRSLAGGLPVITQNVDGLHQRAGSTECVELHGSVRTHSHAWLGTAVAVGGALDPATPPAPFARPDVVMFGERVPLIAFFAARAHVDALEPGDVLLVVGTTCAVAPAAALPRDALLRGAHVVEVNPAPSLDPDDGDVTQLAGAAGDVLPALARRVRDLAARPAEPLPPT